MKKNVILHLIGILLAVCYLSCVDSSLATYEFGCKKIADQVIVHCHSVGDGFGDYSSGLYVVMKFIEEGFKVTLLISLPVTVLSTRTDEQEIGIFLEIFQSSFSSLYNMKISDILFYTNEEPSQEALRMWPENYFAFNDLASRLPNSANVFAFIFCPQIIPLEFQSFSDLKYLLFKMFEFGHFHFEENISSLKIASVDFQEFMFTIKLSC